MYASPVKDVLSGAGSSGRQGACAHRGQPGHAGAAAGHQWGLPPWGAHLPHGGQWSWQNHPHGRAGWQKDMYAPLLLLQGIAQSLPLKADAAHLHACLTTAPYVLCLLVCSF